MPRLLKIILSLLVFFAGFLLYLRNNQSVVLDFYLTRVEFSVILLLVIALIAGAGLGVLVSLPMLGRLKRETWRLRRQVKDCREELDKLRVIPLKDKH